MRRRRHEEHVNHEAWAIPYADLMTLLLAFFVVMYAVSVVNEGKFRVMSESLIEAFNGSSHAIAPLPPTRIRPHNIAPAIAAPAGQSGSSIVPIAVPIPPHPVPASGGSGREAGHQSKQQQENLGRIEDQVRKALQPLIDRKLVVVRHKPDWLEIEIRTDILFPSGVAQLSEPANAVLRDLAAILARFGNPLRVEGFTDDVPISNALYPSNWELSAARAASVARLFSMTGIAPARLGIIGWGEMRPVADNATVEGRNQNRRVLVVVMSDRPAVPRDHVTPEHVDEVAGLATAPAPIVEMMPTVRVSSGSNGTPARVASGAESPALPDVVAGGPAHRTNSSK
ncbi:MULTISPECIES: flagellar motor protein MotD [unclassified Rhodanobacter]|uniref:flagellar motor protein MotD n=1 Tax=unclassified Rhodanobacter TaxID=2621553 RepID=UPI001BE02751|nr:MULTISPECIES: flagellar motor protein MotD [unclassified Rhodanobacter]MBT2145221.1 flagellar motor protein MotD [Rhodanobacter sp. LX-99]MBT2149266.1 flagellar motor protein MotD [Rhodanobacter sp. LX-100]